MTTHEHELVLLVETVRDRDFCRSCGVRAVSKGRARTLVRDVPSGDRPVLLVWRKRIWRCEQPQCSAGSWRESCDAIRPRAVLTERARRWALRTVGRDGLSVALVARELGVGWHTVNAAVLELGQQLLDDDDRLEGVRALGMDETNFLRGSYSTPTSWITGFVDVASGRLLDVVQERTSGAVRDWIGAQPSAWRERIEVATMDPYQGYALELRTALPDADIVVDHWHIVRLANQMLEDARRRVQQETTGHRGRKGDPLYDVRKLLLVALDRLTEPALQRIDRAWLAGDPWHEVEAAWVANEVAAGEVAVDVFLDWAAQVDIAELNTLATTVHTWRQRIIGYHRHRLSNGRTEAMNLLIKKIKSRPRLPQLHQLPHAPTVALRRDMEHARHRTNQRARPLVRCVEPSIQYCERGVTQGPIPSSSSA